MKKPSFLKKGDLVAIVSPSGPIQKSYIDSAILILKSWGLHVEVGKNAYEVKGTFAGTDEQRLADLQNAFDNPNYKAIFCSRGGFGAVRIASKLDYTQFLINPKWLIGFSDITILHSQIHSHNIASIHGAMPKNFNLVTPESLESLQKALFGIIETINTVPSKYNKTGVCSGQLVGGNLSILYSLRGIPYEFDYTNKILFIEDLNEFLYHIDRMMQNFKNSGILSKISGLIVGTMSNMKQGADPYDAGLEEIILDAVSEYNIPICFDFPCGHDKDHQALILGGNYTLKVTNLGGKLSAN